jgi:uncharacterized protein YdhG (YjbR/CyaY superfamily)
VTTPATVDAYLASIPPEAQAGLRAIRQVIRDVLPDAEEAISYGIPTYKVGGKPVVHVAAWKGHLSLYPVPHDEALIARLAPYRFGKGTLRFELGEPPPMELIEAVVRALVDERFGASRPETTSGPQA